MTRSMDRRSFLAAGLASPAALTLAAATDPPPVLLPDPNRFPHQPPELVKELVAACHFDLERVTTLVDARPALSRAAWDWGFGDWETALGAASHTGQREIAQYLISRGARATLFSSAMLGHVDVVRALVRASPGVEATPGPHGITLLAHARAGGDPARSVASYLEELGTADQRAPSNPLATDAMTPYLGEYVYGPGAADFITIEERRGDLRLVPAEDTARVLFAVGDHTFFPSGVPSVRIRFEMGRDVATALVVSDADTTLEARRRP